MASEYEGPGLRVPVTQNEIHDGFCFHGKTQDKGTPPGATPTQGAHVELGRERGLAPPGPAKRAPPQRGGASTGEEKGKGR